MLALEGKVGRLPKADVYHLNFLRPPLPSRLFWHTQFLFCRNLESFSLIFSLHVLTLLLLRSLSRTGIGSPRGEEFSVLPVSLLPSVPRHFCINLIVIVRELGRKEIQCFPSAFTLFFFLLCFSLCLGNSQLSVTLKQALHSPHFDLRDRTIIPFTTTYVS